MNNKELKILQDTIFTATDSIFDIQQNLKRMRRLAVMTNNTLETANKSDVSKGYICEYTIPTLDALNDCIFNYITQIENLIDSIDLDALENIDLSSVQNGGNRT